MLVQSHLQKMNHLSVIYDYHLSWGIIEPPFDATLSHKPLFRYTYIRYFYLKYVNMSLNF